MIGDTLKNLRTQAKYEAQFVAKKLNVIKQHIYAKNKKTNPSFEIVCKIPDLFNCTTDYLLGRTNIKDAVLPENDDLPEELNALEKAGVKVKYTYIEIGGIHYGRNNEIGFSKT